MEVQDSGDTNPKMKRKSIPLMAWYVSEQSSLHSLCVVC